MVFQLWVEDSVYLSNRYECFSPGTIFCQFFQWDGHPGICDTNYQYCFRDQSNTHNKIKTDQSIISETMTFLHASSLLVLFAFSLAIPSKHMVKRSTALSELVDNGEYFGCYSTTSWLEGAIKTDMGETASNIHCQSICQQSGFIFAAIQGILKHILKFKSTLN